MKMREILLIVIIIMGVCGILVIGTMIELYVYIGLGILVFSSIVGFLLLNWDLFFKKKK